MRISRKDRRRLLVFGLGLAIIAAGWLTASVTA